MKYMISRQGNRNLVLGRDENVFYDGLDSAMMAAERKATLYHEGWFVFEVTPRLVTGFRPRRAEEISRNDADACDDPRN